MIVDADFPDHWKTRLLVNELSDEAAPVYVLRIWAHCQNRKQDTFDNLPPEALKALCRFPGNANKLVSSLVTSGFIRIDAGVVTVVNWAEYNAKLIAAWENGKKGGRPAKPTKRTGLPVGNPTETNKSREEEIRGDQNNSGSGGRPPPEKPIGLLLDADDFLAVWNANQHTRKVHFASLIPGQRDLIDRLQNPAWVENFAQALAKLPLKAMRDPTISVEWFLKEDTVGKILNGSYDFEPTPGRGQPAAPQPPRRITRTPLE